MAEQVGENGDTPDVAIKDGENYGKTEGFLSALGFWGTEFSEKSIWPWNKTQPSVVIGV